MTAGRWTRGLGAVRRRPWLRASSIGVLTVAQAFVLFSAAMWWLETGSTDTTATVAPMTWTGVVHDVGTAGVNMRANPAVADGNGRDVAARGARLALQCGQTGAVVTREDGTQTATWLRTTDGLWVSMLYVHVPDRTSIPSCPGSPSDGPLLAVSDPTASEQPPPPGSRLGSARPAPARDSAASRRDSASSKDSTDTTTEAQAATPAPDVAVGPSGEATASTTTSAPDSSTPDPASGQTVGNGLTRKTYHQHSAQNPDLVPVG